MDKVNRDPSSQLPTSKDEDFIRRRRVLKGAAAIPAIATLGSGQSAAAASIFNCAQNEVANSYAPNAGVVVFFDSNNNPMTTNTGNSTADAAGLLVHSGNAPLDDLSSPPVSVGSMPQFVFQDVTGATTSFPVGADKAYQALFVTLDQDGSLGIGGDDANLLPSCYGSFIKLTEV